MVRFWFVVLGLGLAVSSRADALDDVIRVQMRRQGIPGLAVAVMRKGKLVTARGYGLANVELGTKVRPDTPFRIGSLSKQFLAAATMRLVEERRLDLDAPIGRYLGKVPTAWEAITVRQLLSHTSGLVRDQPGFDPFQPVSLDAEIQKAVASPLRFEAGKGWAYSNVGYYVLAQIVEKVAGEPWDGFVARRIFDPAGMKATRVAQAEAVVPGRATGYSMEEGERRNAEIWRAVRPSGAFLSTVRDFARWDEALWAGRVLSPAGIQQMWTPASDQRAYGFGWFLDPLRGHRRVYHGGGVPGFQADFQRLLDDEVSVVVMVNTDQADLSRITERVLGIYVPGVGPREYRKVSGVEPSRGKLVERLFTSLREPRPDRDLLTPRLLGILEKDWEKGAGFFTRLGVLRKVEPVERKVGGDARAVRFRLTFRERSFLVVVTFEGDRVDDYDLEEE